MKKNILVKEMSIKLLVLMLNTRLFLIKPFKILIHFVLCKVREDLQSSKNILFYESLYAFETGAFNQRDNEFLLKLIPHYCLINFILFK